VVLGGGEYADGGEVVGCEDGRRLGRSRQQRLGSHDTAGFRVVTAGDSDVLGKTVLAHRLVVTAATAAGSGIWSAVDVRDVAVTEVDEVLDGQFGSDPVVDRDDVDANHLAPDDYYGHLPG